MTTDTTLWTFITNAGPVVKAVMTILVAASIMSWSFIIQRGLLFSTARKQVKSFESTFWSGADLNKLYEHLKPNAQTLTGLEKVFFAGFDAYLRSRQQGNLDSQTVLDGAQRAMRVAISREQDRLEQNLAFLATVGSTSPYVGLFGTVWGLMMSIRALGSVQQASIAMVAPGISETLIATAMGLFAAIPAYIAYNRYSYQLERICNTYDTFQEEFFSLLQRQTAN